MSNQIVSINKSDIKELAKNSLDYFAGLAIPHVYSMEYPPVFQTIWSILIGGRDQRTSQVALGIPRGFGKTTLAKLFLAHSVYYSSKKYILIVASTQAKADNILRDVVGVLASANMVAVYGDATKTASVNNAHLFLTEFNGRSIAIQAIGTGSDPRGSSIEWARPDFIYCDDAQSREDAFSPAKSRQFRDWFEYTLKYTRNEASCQFVYTGNMFPTEDCLLLRLHRDPKWTSLVVGAVTIEGKSLWEAHKPIAQIYSELEDAISHDTLDSFCAEVLNDYRTTVRTPLSLSDITAIPTDTIEANATGGFVVIDPAGEELRSDDTAIGVFLLVDGVPYLTEVISKVLTPPETIETAIDLCAKYGVSLIAVESYAYQKSLIHWFNRTMSSLGIYGIDCVGITRGKLSKNRAIIDMVTSLRKHEIGLASELVTTVLSYITMFNPESKTNKDDVLDLLVYSLMVVAVHSNKLTRVLYDDSTVIEAVTPEYITSIL